MIYLLEIDPVDPSTGQVVTLRYGSAGFTTWPSDTPSNTWFEERIVDPGNYERFMFGRSRTRGESDVGGGDIQLANADGALDFLLNLAFDGRAFRLYGLADETAAWASRDTILVGTMEQVEFPSRRVSIRIRDRLALLRDTIQTQTYAGTTISGVAGGVEGNKDLKDVRKPLLFGRAFSIPPVLVDQFNSIYQVAANPLTGIFNVSAARDNGVLLTATSDYPTLAALKAATLTGGQYATCLALGLLRVQTRPSTLTVDATEGATLADRSAARIVQRMIASAGGTSAADFNALHTANPAECGIWTGTHETTILSAAVEVLASIGGYLTVDRLGVYRVGRLELPTGPGEVVLDETNILGGEAISRQATNDDGDGVPARSVTVQWGRAYTTFSEEDLKNVNATDAYRAFAVQEWRLAKVTSAANVTLHPKGPELVFDSCLCNETDAMAEATRLLAIYAARRDVFTLQVAADEIPTVDLGDVVTLAPNRFGMAAGVPARVIGLTPTLSTNITEIEVWR
ncbi:hypothetical protein ASG43_20565 [Aureimonas sp. Leaf454]|uniref:hypothetical protein n=1 Tax=Aureimonas sp. Leaf454 TaxID=1736381 RepID=UPI0006F2EBB4|nr:hypothetical protein [Aureimonas sp. Leaf454]KQT51976.1 hypothetical protein ASG43_20565 [Aureimonas sp. Leaf454]